MLDLHVGQCSGAELETRICTLQQMSQVKVRFA